MLPIFQSEKVANPRERGLVVSFGDMDMIGLGLGCVTLIVMGFRMKFEDLRFDRAFWPVPIVIIMIEPVVARIMFRHRQMRVIA